MRFKLSIVLAVLASCVVQTKPEQSNQYLDSVHSICLVRTTTATGSEEFGTCFAYKSQEVKTLEETLYKTYFLTNHHVVEDRDETKSNVIYTSDPFWLSVPDFLQEERSIPYAVEFSDEFSDVAVISVVTRDQIPTLALDNNIPSFGQEIFCIGYPLGSGVLLTKGHVGHYIAADRKWIASCQITFGNSGGPVMDQKTGKVIGITKGMAAINSVPLIHLWHLQNFIPCSDVCNMLVIKDLL